MRRQIVIATFVGLVCGLSQRGGRGDGASDGPVRPLILVHYMPWYESKASSGHWGWHWTMGRFDPERTDVAGRPEIASHYHPLIGPYDNGDADVLEYHALLMRVAGIDGVIVDWYGSEDFNDYDMIHRRTTALFDWLGRHKMKFAVCYEDRVLKVMSEQGKLSPAQALEHARNHLRICEQDWFQRPHYVTWRGKPLLLVFGPEYLGPAQWENLFSTMSHPPALFTLHERREPAVGSFAWPPMWAAKDGVLDLGRLDAYLDRFDRQSGGKIAAAFPGFHDIYGQAGVQASYGRLDDRNGDTFRHTFERAVGSGGPCIQVVTWNDFGEGTCIEPAVEYGYRYLETIQQVARRSPGEHSPYRAADLRIPLRIHRLRKYRGPGAPERKALDQVAGLLFDGETARAAQRLDKLEAAAKSK
jgi:hypothetical protein